MDTTGGGRHLCGSLNLQVCRRPVNRCSWLILETNSDISVIPNWYSVFAAVKQYTDFSQRLTSVNLDLRFWFALSTKTYTAIIGRAQRAVHLKQPRPASALSPWTACTGEDLLNNLQNVVAGTEKLFLLIWKTFQNLSKFNSYFGGKNTILVLRRHLEESVLWVEGVFKQTGNLCSFLPSFAFSNGRKTTRTAIKEETPTRSKREFHSSLFLLFLLLSVW